MCLDIFWVCLTQFKIKIKEHSKKYVTILIHNKWYIFSVYCNVRDPSLVPGEETYQNPPIPGLAPNAGLKEILYNSVSWGVPGLVEQEQPPSSPSCVRFALWFDYVVFFGSQLPRYASPQSCNTYTYGSQRVSMLFTEN